MSKVPFKSIADYIDEIERGFVAKESPEAIASRLGIPEKAKTIRRYKAAVWDLRELVAETKEERMVNHEARREEAKIEIIRSLDLIEKIKMRAWQHLDWEPGMTAKRIQNPTAWFKLVPQPAAKNTAGDRGHIPLKR